MAFSKELESLINDTLEDGKLEKYELEALQKRALAEGVDLTELEIHINGILQRRAKKEQEKKEAQYAKMEEKKIAAIGKTCPNCGKQVQSLALNCECGYEFKQEKRVSSVQEFYKEFTNIYVTEEERISVDGEPKEVEKLKCNKQIEFINTFPVPNTKEDIMEFLAMAAPLSKIKGGLWGTTSGRWTITGILIIVSIIFCTIYYKDIDFDVDYPYLGMILVIVNILVLCRIDEGQDTLNENKRAVAWRDKFEQVLMKGRSLRADTEFQKMLDYYENIVKKNKKLLI
jgi:hypothetical protein